MSYWYFRRSGARRHMSSVCLPIRTQSVVAYLKSLFFMEIMAVAKSRQGAARASPENFFSSFFSPGSESGRLPSGSCACRSMSSGNLFFGKFVKLRCGHQVCFETARTTVGVADKRIQNRRRLSVFRDITSPKRVSYTALEIASGNSCSDWRRPADRTASQGFVNALTVRQATPVHHGSLDLNTGKHGGSTRRTTTRRECSDLG